MIKNICSILVVAIAVAFSISCNQPGTTSNAPLPKNDATGKPPFMVNAQPKPDTEVAVVEMENPVYGKYTIELYPNVAPKMVARFKELIKEGFYDGLSYHRINGSVIQAGDPLSKTNDPRAGSGKSGKSTVQAEFSDIPYDSGIVGAARLGNDINSQDSQFFVTLQREKGFDKSYTIFGKVIDGMANVRTIAGAPKQGERPTDPIKIKSITLQPHP